MASMGGFQTNRGDLSRPGKRVKLALAWAGMRRESPRLSDAHGFASFSKSFAGRTLFEDVSLQVNRGDRIGLVGPNGAGKSTLFSLILGEATPDEGRVALEKLATLDFLPQENAPAGDETVLELALREFAAELRDADRTSSSAWEIEPKAKRILRGWLFANPISIARRRR